jgi:hypothetical protein
VAALNRDFDATETIIAERAVSPEVQDAPGGKTGHVVRTLKMLGSGEFGREVEEFGYDQSIIQSRMALMKQASQELHQWTEKREVTGKDGAPLAIVQHLDLSALADDELHALEQTVAKLALPRSNPSRASEAEFEYLRRSGVDGR